MERFDEELDEDVAGEENDEADVIRGIRSLDSETQSTSSPTKHYNL